MEHNNLKGKKGVKRVTNACKYSYHGFLTAYKDEEAFRQVLYMFLVAFPLSALLASSILDFIILMIPLFICLIVELLNTGIENAIDRISLEIHPLSKKAKDLGSAAQFSSLALTGFVWICVIIKNIF